MTNLLKLSYFSMLLPFVFALKLIPFLGFGFFTIIVILCQLLSGFKYTTVLITLFLTFDFPSLLNSSLLISNYFSLFHINIPFYFILPYFFFVSLLFFLLDSYLITHIKFLQPNRLRLILKHINIARHRFK